MGIRVGRLVTVAERIAAHAMRATRINFFYDQVLVKEPGTVEPGLAQGARLDSERFPLAWKA